MATTQAAAPESSQASAPVHPIHEETALLNRLTEYVANTPDNDPHEGTDLEAPKEATAEQAAEGKPAEAETFELDEESPLFEVEYKTDSGKEQKKLSLKELREGYLAKADYHRNIQRVKAQETDLQNQIRQAETKAQQAAVEKLETYKQALLRSVAPELNGVDLNKLAMEDPAQAQRIFFKQIQVNQLLQGIETEQSQARAKLDAEQQAAFSSAVEKSRQTLQSDIPGWSDETYHKVLDTVSKDYGFESKDVAKVVDARLVKVFHDAYQYRQLQKAKPEANKRVVAVPKVVKPGSGEKANPAQERTAELAATFKKTGRVEDAALWYLNKSRKG